MNFNIKQAISVCGLVSLTLFLLYGLNSIFTKATENAEYLDNQITEVAVVKSYEQPSYDFSAITSRYEALQPAEDIEPDKKSSPDDIVVEKVIDKTLRPNFQTLDDEHQVGLVAVFGGESPFAVLQLINFETSRSKFEKVVVGESIGAFKLDFVSELSASFSSSESTMLLSLFNKKVNS